MVISFAGRNTTLVTKEPIRDARTFWLVSDYTNQMTGKGAVESAVTSAHDSQLPVVQSMRFQLVSWSPLATSYFIPRHTTQTPNTSLLITIDIGLFHTQTHRTHTELSLYATYLKGACWYLG